MEQGLNSSPNPPSGPIDKSRVYDVKPLRSLAPVFPNPEGMSSVSTPNPSPFVCVPPSGPFPPGVQPFYPFMATNNSQPATNGGGARNQSRNAGFHGSIPAPIPLNSFRTPTSQANGGSSRNKRASRTRGSASVVIEDDGYSDSQNQSDQFVGGFSMHDGDGASNSVKRSRGRTKRRKSVKVGSAEEIDVEALVNSILTSFKLKELDDFRKSSGDKDTTTAILLAFDLIRRRLSQAEEAKDTSPGVVRRPDLKTSNLLMTKGVRTNNSKRIGHVPGVDVGDIFFFRMELCLVGLHAPSMAGIDYLSVKITGNDEPLAVSIVAAGGYDDDDGDDTNVLIYSGQGGVARRDGQMFDQKLERGNLALEKSLHRGNDVRVIRGVKDAASTGKIYAYDGVYRIVESWAEKNKSGCNVFKYKLIRQPGQPEVFSLWKSIQQWREGKSTRPGLIIPDLTSGAETQPVALVNDVDGEKGPEHFTYVASLRYSQPLPSSRPTSSCHCSDGCQQGDADCPCTQKNDGLLPYTYLGVILISNMVINECGTDCKCPENCRNRISQAGIKLRLEVFKTKNRGWGLRSWDPIRSGAFICEFAGDVIKTTAGDFENEDDNYIFDAGRYYEPLELVNNSMGAPKAPFPLVISAKNNGNVSRFMNHSCSPNVYWQPVLRESNNNVFLHIAFFAIRHIPPLQELVYDYGVPTKVGTGKKRCFCGSMKCKGYFF